MIQISIIKKKRSPLYGWPKVIGDSGALSSFGAFQLRYEVHPYITVITAAISGSSLLKRFWFIRNKAISTTVKQLQI